MCHREIPAETRRQLLEQFARIFARLTAHGIRIVFDFPEEVRARQAAWPEGWPLSEAELRCEIQALRPGHGLRAACQGALRFPARAQSVARLGDFVRGRDPLERRLARALCRGEDAGEETLPKKEEDAA